MGGVRRRRSTNRWMTEEREERVRVEGGGTEDNSAGRPCERKTMEVHKAIFK